MAQPTGAQSVDRALSLLLAIGRYGEAGAGLAELCAEFELTKPTCRRLLLSLMRAELVEQPSETNGYRLGRAAYVLGSFASRRFALLEDFKNSLLRLAEQTGDTCILTVRQGDFGVVVGRAEGSYPIRSHTIHPGQKIPLGIGAAGIAILSVLEDDEIDETLVLNAELIARKYSANTQKKIRSNVREARRNGYSLNRGLVFPHVWGVAGTIHPPGGEVMGAITVSAIDHRMNQAHIDMVSSCIQTEIKSVLKNEPS